MSRAETPPLSRRERRAQQRYERPTRSERLQRRRRTEPRWRSPLVLVTCAAVIAGAVLVFLALPRGGNDDDVHLVMPPNSYAAALVDGETLGSPDAPVVIELYSDFQCPACRLFVRERMPRLVAEYVVPGTVRIEARDIDILGRTSPSESLELAAGARCAAEQDRYWQFHDLVFWNQGRENRGDHDAAFIGRVADAAGLDRAAFDACLAGDAARQPIRAQTADALARGISSTPTLVINGQALVGVPAYDQLAAYIDQQIEAGATPS